MNIRFSPIIKYLLCTLILATFFQCASTQKKSEIDDIASDIAYNETDSDQVNTDDHGNTPLNLGDLLRRVSGIQISGSDDNITIKVRGAQSFDSGTEPLFVIDGTPMGTSYADVNRIINPRLVKRINVLKGSASALYGSRAANGVISIEMKKGN